MTFDPRWLNQIPLASINGGDANALVSLTGSTRLDVADWSQSVAVATIDTNGGQPLATAKLRSGNMFVAYEDGTSNFKAAVINPAGSVVVPAVTIDVASGSGNYLKAATLSNGNVVICFNEPYAGLKIRFAIYDERLNVVTPSTVVVGTREYDRYSVTALADGNFVVGYANGTSKSAFQIFDQDGDVVRTEVVISTANYDSNNVVGLQNGNFMSFITNATDAWYYIYDRQGVQVLGATSLGTLGTMIDYPTALLSNGHVAYAYNNSNDIYAGIIDQDGNEVVASTAITTGATFTVHAALFSLPNNTYGLAYRNSAATAAYFQIRNYLNAVVKAQTAFGGTWALITTLTAGAFSNGNFLFLVQDTDIKRTIWQGSKASFANDLEVLGDFTLSSGVAVNEISNSALASSATALPTSYAVKLYVDQATGNVERNVIHEGDSKVEVQDSTSEVTQYITMVLNGTEYGRIEDTGTTITALFGQPAGTNFGLDTNTGEVYATSTAKVLSLLAAQQTIGLATDEKLLVDQTLNKVSAYVGNTELLSIGSDEQVLGRTADTAVKTTQTTDAINLYSASNIVGTFNPSGLTLANGSAVNEFSQDESLGGFNGATASSTAVPTESAVRGYIDGIHEEMRDPTGITDRADSTVSMVGDTFSIEPTGTDFTFYLSGQKYIVDASASIAITDVEGMHYIYYDGNTGVLSHTTTFSLDLILHHAYVAAIYWDADNDQAIYVGDERHGIQMDGRTHYWMHESQGTIYISGLALGDIIADGTGTLNTEAQLSVSSGLIYDEDLGHSINALTAPANIPMFYKSGALGNWRREAADNFPITNTGTGRAAWNEFTGGSWQKTEATEGYFVLTHIFATNDLTTEVIGVVGQNQYSTITAAREGAAEELNTLVLAGLPFVEFVAIASVIFETSSSFTNTPKSIIRTTDLGADYVDWRYSKISAVPGTVTDHGALAGLGDDDHLQYARLTGLRPFTGLTTFQAGVTVSGGSLTLDNGVAINDISSNTSLGTSNTAVPTQNAVKSYVDTQIANLNPDKIWADDSKVEVVDDGTATGYVQIVTDGVQVAYFDVLASTQRIGKTATNLSITDTTVKANVNSNTYLEIDPVGSEWIRIGRAGGGLGARIDLGTASGGQVDVYADNGISPVQALSLQAIEQFIGVSGNVQLGMNQTNNTVYISTTSYNIFDFASDVLKVGKSNGTRVEINESTDVITLNPNNVVQATIDSAGLTLANGVGINEFSIDGTLAGDSTSVVPTEYAVKDYVDTAIAGLAPNRIWQLNSEVVVTDTGTDGNVSIKADALEVGSFTDNRVIIGDVNTVYFKADFDDSELFFNTASGQKGSVAQNRIWFGDNGINAGIEINTDDKTTEIYAGDSPDLVKVALDSTSVSMFINETDTVFYATTSDTFGVGNPNGASGTAWILGTTEGIKVIDVDSTDQIALFDSTGLQLATGAKINEFSTDDTLGDATPSDNTVPTQAAVKAYVDSQIGGQANRIWEGDSEVRVTDAGTGSIVTKADNTDVQSLTLNTQRVGQAASSRVELVVSPAPTVDLYAGTTNVFNGSLTSVTVGMSADTRMNINNVADIISFATGNINVAQLSLTTLRIGQAADSRLELDTTNDYADLYAGTTQIIDGATTSQTFGVSGDSNLFLDQANNYADLYAGANRIVRGELNLQVFGVVSDSRMETDQTNDTIDLYAGNVKVVNGTTNVLTLGVSGDTYFAINQADDQINAYTGNTLQMQVENSGVSVEGDLTVRGNLSIDGTAFIVFNEEVKTEDNIITVNYGDPGPGVTRGIAGLEVDRGSEPIYQFIFQESTDTFRVGETGQTQAVATRENDPDGYKVAWWSDDDRMFKTLGDEYIKIDQSSNNIIFVTGLAQRALIDSNGLTLQLGTSVNKFSTDVTLAGDSDDAVPTEKAVKTYVDSQIGGQANIIFQDDSNVTVTDDGTAAGYIIVTADGAPVATFMNNYVQIMNPLTAGALFDVEVSTPGVFAAQVGASGWGMYAYDDTTGPSTGVNLGYINGTAPLLQITGDNGIAGANALTLTLLNSASTDVVPLSITSVEQRLGIDSDTRLLVNQSLDSVLVYIASDATPVMNLQSNMQQLGKSGDTMVSVNQSANLVAFVANNVNVVSVTDTTARIGIAGDSRLFLDSGNDIADLYAGAVQIIDGATTSQVFGVAGDSRLTLDQSTDIAAIYAGAKQLILLEPTIATFGNGDEAKLTVTATQATLYAGTTAVATAVATSQTFGVGSDTRLFLDQANNLADLYAGTTQIIDGAMTSQTFGVSGDSRLALDQTADTAQLYAGATLALDCGVNVITLGTAADTNIALNQSADTVVIEIANVTQATFGVTGLTLQTGAAIVEFSIDGTLVGNADTVVPTEQAVKTYVDTEIEKLRQELDLINVRNVYADTTASTGDVVLADTTAGDITIQLLESTDGKIIIKKKSTDGNKVYITTTPGMIDGQSQIIIDTGYQAYTFVCDGTNFFII